MFKTIIVGVDAREGGRDALALGDALASLSGGELIAVHAYPIDYYVGRGSTAGFEAELERAAGETLQSELAATRIGARPVTVADTSPARALHVAAEHEGADLIVVGSAHRGAIGRVLAGDVTAGTLHGAPCPVLVAPVGYADLNRAFGTIGVGYDGSPESRAAVELARDLAEAAGARLRIIDVVVPPQPGGPYPAYRPDWSEHTRIRREEAEERVEAMVAELGDIATGRVVIGYPADVLAGDGEELDVLVTGSRNFGPLRRVMLGSTSSKLVHRAPCPVLVTPRAARDASEATPAAAAAGQTSS